MNMRSLNSFAGGAARGIEAGSQMANRKQLTDLAVKGDARADKALASTTAFNQDVLKLLRENAPGVAAAIGGTGEAPGEAPGHFEGSMSKPAPTFTQTVGQAPAPAAAYQPTMAGQAPVASQAPSALQQQLPPPQATMRPRQLPPESPFANLIGYGG